MTLFIKKAIKTIVVLAVAFCILTVNSAALSEDLSSFPNGNSVVCVAHRGDWHSFPENSREAVNAAIDYGAISVDVKLTKDSVLVLMADDTLDRMCTTPKGEAVTGKVADRTLDELREFNLRQGNGGSDKAMTDSKIPTLEEIIETVGGRALLILNMDSEIFKNAYGEIDRLGAKNDVVFRFTDSMSKIKKNVAETDVKVIGNYQGNIVFIAYSAYKDCLEYGYTTLELGSANGHGVLYDNFLMKNFGGDVKAMASMVNGRSGDRADSERGWDDLISRNYTVIETDYPEELCDYIKRTESAYTELQKYIDLYKLTDLSVYTTDTEDNFCEALVNAQALKSSDSLSEINEARGALQSAHDNLTVGEKKAVALSFKFTPGRIITAVLCGFAFILSQILLWKRKEKQQ